MFDYDLPDTRIAQRPVHPPESAQLLVYDRANDRMIDTVYDKITDFIRPGDIFIFNQSKVIPARFFGQIGDASAELLLLRRSKESLWLCLGRPMRKFQPGSTIKIIDAQGHQAGIEAVIVERTGEKEVLVQFSVSDDELFSVGTMPIPPYIRNGKGDAQDIKDYQSIFAVDQGSVAAPTASLHFSEVLINKMTAAGAQIKQVVLHVGAASFLPLWNPEDKSEQIVLKRPGIELFQYSTSLLDELMTAKASGKRIIPVGTTVVRALESMAKRQDSSLDGQLVETDLFIQPGFNFQLCSSLVTNFHQPRTTHLLLVSAFCTEAKLEKIYAHALQNLHYRFLSYGDGMFII